MRSADALPQVAEPEPRWQALIAVLAIAGLNFALPAYMRVGPLWLLPAVILALLVPTVMSHRVGWHRATAVFGALVTTVLTGAMLVSLAFLIRGLPSHKESPTELLLSAGSLWFTNVLVFALWYWRLDAGGPHGREARPGHERGAFLFPQMTMLPEIKAAAGDTHWSPHFVDYLFLAFNTSTAFSPTDTPVLMRWAKVLMMTQSAISLAVLAILAARAVNML